MAAAVPLAVLDQADHLVQVVQVVQVVPRVRQAQAAVRGALEATDRADQALDHRMDQAAVAADRAAFVAVPVIGLGLATIGSQYQYRIHAVLLCQVDHRQFAFALPTNLVRQVRMSAKLFTPVALKE